MAKIILKWRYLKPGTRNHNQNLVKYIAKRDGVEKIDDSWKSLPVSVQQKKMIEQLLKDFPDTADSYEYQDYFESRPTNLQRPWVSLLKTCDGMRHFIMRDTILIAISFPILWGKSHT